MLSKETKDQIRKERWRPVVGFEGYYEVSDYGNVRSVDREYVNPRSGLCKLKGKLLTAGKGGRGYLTVALSKAGLSKSVLVHRLVAAAFIENPDNKPQVNHKDTDPINNYYKNLEWCTNQENTVHFFKNNQHVVKTWDRRGQKNNLSKLTDDAVRKIRMSTLSYRKLAKIFGCSNTAIQYVKRRMTWTHVV